jgi:ketosteroid isomerase-like protein
MTRQKGDNFMSNNDDVTEINARYRAYCDACQSNQLEKVPSFWSLPALFTVDTGKPGTLHQVLSSPEEMIKLYGTLFGPSTGVNKTVIDSSEVTFYGDKLATIKTSLRHLAGSKLHDRQDAVYGCCKIDGEWAFVSHLSVDLTEHP